LVPKNCHSRHFINSYLNFSYSKQKQLSLLSNFFTKKSNEIISKFIRICQFLWCQFLKQTLPVIVSLSFSLITFFNYFFELHHDPRILFTFWFILLILVARMIKMIFEIIVFRRRIILVKNFKRIFFGLFHLLLLSYFLAFNFISLLYERISSCNWIFQKVFPRFLRFLFIYLFTKLENLNKSDHSYFLT
jgi:hypothetical protein